MDELNNVILTLTQSQRRDLITLYNWCKQLSIGRGLRTGRYLAEKGLAKDTGEMYNYSTRWIITDLGKSVAEQIR